MTARMFVVTAREFVVTVRKFVVTAREFVVILAEQDGGPSRTEQDGAGLRTTGF